MAEEYEFIRTYKDHMSFQGRYFCGMELSSEYFGEGDLQELELQACVFRKSDFSEADFSGAELENCLFRGCNLSGAVFEDVTGEGVSFVECEMRGVSFRGASVGDISFIDCEGRMFFEGAFMRKAHFNGCDMPESTFPGAMLAGSIFAHCDLTGTRYDSETVLTAVTLDHTTITDARMVDAVGVRELILNNVQAMPWGVSGSRRITPHLHMPPNRSQSVNSASTSIYGGKNLAAKLYCAGKEEFRRAKR
jgi:hypothetical protein